MYMKIFTCSLVTLAILACHRPDIEPPKTDLSKLSPAQKSALELANNDVVFKGTDLGFWVRGTTLASIINSINTIPLQGRTLSIVAVGQTDRLVDETEYYLELYDLHNNIAAAELTNVSTSWSEDGKLKFTGSLTFGGDIRIHAHAKNYKTGGHLGARIESTANINGQIGFAPSTDPKKLFDVSFDLAPSKLQVGVHSAISDSKEVCWRIELFGHEGKDCKLLWQYNIPIGFDRAFDIKTDKSISIPVQLNLPREIRLTQNWNGITFDKSAHIDITPKEFKSDSIGMALHLQVDIAPTKVAQAF